MSVRVLLLCFVMSGPASSPASAQGFAGLGAQVEGFTIPTPGYQFAFPADHGAHTDFRIEWWYLTANLKDADGVDYGVQWTLFRTALAPGDKAGWSSPQLWMGHAAVTTATIRLWGTPIGYVAMDRGERFARFEYDPAFAAARIELRSS